MVKRMRESAKEYPSFTFVTTTLTTKVMLQSQKSVMYVKSRKRLDIHIKTGIKEKGMRSGVIENLN